MTGKLFSCLGPVLLVSFLMKCQRVGGSLRFGFRGLLRAVCRNAWTSAIDTTLPVFAVRLRLTCARTQASFRPESNPFQLTCFSALGNDCKKQAYANCRLGN